METTGVADARPRRPGWDSDAAIAAAEPRPPEDPIRGGTRRLRAGVLPAGRGGGGGRDRWAGEWRPRSSRWAEGVVAAGLPACARAAIFDRGCNSPTPARAGEC